LCVDYLLSLQANLPNAQEPHIEQDFTDDLIKLDEGDNLDEDMDLMHDLFGSAPYKLSGSPTHHDDPDRQAFSGVNGSGRDPNANELMDVETEELSNHSLLQQPLAVGFYVSTAPTGPLPTWFWSTCPQRENHCPVCFQVSTFATCVLYYCTFSLSLYLKLIGLTANCMVKKQFIETTSQFLYVIATVFVFVCFVIFLVRSILSVWHYIVCQKL